jgi:RNA polymerase sigma-70 factor (ECF subfamily)
MLHGQKFSGFSLNSVESPNVDRSELRLVDRAAAGDRDAQRVLFERYRAPAYQVALRITGRNEDALDAVQDSFIKAFERLGSFQRQAGFKTWLLRIVTNRALDLLRARRVRLAVPLDGDDDAGAPAPVVDQDAGRPDDPLDQVELAERLGRAMAGLPADQRAAFALHATGDMTYGQIAEVLGIPIGTVMSRLYHARRRLQAALADLAPSGAARETK